MAAHTTRTGPARVLVVDNDARVRRALCALIESSPGLSVAGEASSGTGALEADQRLRPDVIVLDILLPKADDGIEVLKRLTELGRDVVAVSIRDGLSATAIAAGAVAFVGKYDGPDKLLKTVRSVVARRSGPL